jgi:hypothetical protein
VTEPPVGTSATVERFPEPEAVPHSAPPAPTQVHVAPLSAAGKVSVIAAFDAVDGPLLDTTIVYVSGEPGTAVVLPSVLVIDRSTRGVTESESVAELLPPFVSVNPTGALIDAVFTKVVALDVAGSSVAVNENVKLPPGRIVPVVEMLPVPLAAPQDEPAVAEHVQVAPVRLAGSVSVIGALTTVDGPEFDAMIV